MKTSIIAFAVTIILAACNNKPKTTTESTSVIQKDTASLNSQPASNDQSNLIDTRGVPDTIVTTDGSKFARVPATNEVKSEPAPVATTKASPRKTASKRSTGTAGRSTANKGSESGSGSGSGTSESGTTGSGTTGSTASTTKKKEGWSKAAKGTVIGAGTGAVTGAIISKKKGKGAVIGGLIGAGGGYIIGRRGDKKDGRVDTSKN